MGRDITLCHPELQEKAQQLIKLCEDNGLKIGISECFRTVEEQDALYVQGRTTAGNIVTNAKGSSYSSHHQWGTAFDFYRNDGQGAYNDNDGFFSKVGALGVKLGLEWGGSWTSPVDKPHFQLPQWGSATATLKKLYGTPEEFKKTWGDEMTEAEVKEIVLEVIKNNEPVYNWTLACPEWAIPTVQKLLDNGYLFGDENGQLGLTWSELKILVIMDRAGSFDK